MDVATAYTMAHKEGCTLCKRDQPLSFALKAPAALAAVSGRSCVLLLTSPVLPRAQSFTQAYAAGSANKASSALAGQGAGAQCPCKDSSPDTSYTCDQQKAFGKCDVGWMRQASVDFPNGFCAKTCGKCPSQCQ